MDKYFGWVIIGIVAPILASLLYDFFIPNIIGDILCVLCYITSIIFGIIFIIMILSNK